jgi:hypothetical protein
VILKSAIEKTVTQFHDYPLDFLSERDIQALLFVELRNQTPTIRYPYDADGENSRFGFPLLDPPNLLLRIHPVTTEYYIGNGKRDRFDVAVLSEKADSKSAIWRQPCQIAIEIKLWQPGYRDSDYLRDVEKLQSYQNYLQKNFTEERSFTGIAMLFVHPCVEKLKLTKNAVSKEKFGDSYTEFSDPYPENGVVLHTITHGDHWCKQFPDR